MKCLLIFFAVFPVLAFGQQKYTLRGKITDRETGEDLIGILILVIDLVKGTSTNSSGFYSLSLSEGTYTIRYSYVGYENVENKFNFNKNNVINIELSPSIMALDEVIVSTERTDKKITSAESGVEKTKSKEY